MVDMQASITTELGALRDRLNGNRYARNLMGAFTRTIKLDIEGDGGAAIIFRDGEMMLPDTEVGEEDLLLRLTPGGRFVDVLRGTLDITHTLASGELELAKGKVTDLILWNRIIVAGLKT